MIALAPLALLAPQPQPPALQAHAALHPADSFLYAEVPDVQVLPDAYATTPLARFLADPELHEAIGRMMGSPAMDPRVMLRASLTDLPLEPQAQAQLSGLMGDLQTVSVSLGGWGDGGAEAAAQAATARRTDELLARVQTAVDAAGPEFDGNLDSLEGVDESLRADPWGHPIEVVAGPAGGWVARSLGADGAEGGSFADADRFAGDAPEPALIAFGGLRLRLVLDFATADSAKLVALLPLGLTEQGFDLEVVGEGQRLTNDELPGFGLTIVSDEGRVVVELGPTGGGEPATEPDPESSLATDAEYRDASARLGAATGTVVWSGFQRLSMGLCSDAVQRFGQAPPTGVNRELLAMLSGTGAWRTAIADGMFVKDAAELDVEDGGTVDRSFLDSLPPEAIGAWALPVDAGAAIELALGMASEATGAPREDLLAAVQEAVGVRLDTDLAQYIGDTMFVYCEPLLALGPPKLRVYLELDDDEAFASSLDRVVAWAAENVPPGMGVKSKPYRKVPVHSFDLGDQADLGPMQPSPTLCVVDGALVVSLNSIHAKREIKRLAKLGDEEVAPHPVLARLDAEAEPAAGIGYMDWGALLEGVYGMAKLAAGFFGGMAEVPVDLTALPEPELIGRHFPASFSTTRVVDGASVTHKTSAFGPEVPLGLLAAAGSAAAVTFRQVDGALEVEVSASAPVPVPADAEYRAPEEDVVATRDTLQRVRTGLAVFKLENGRLPATLGELVAPTDSYPRGFLDAPEVPSDAWGQALRYRVDGEQYYLWSVGADGVDESGAGDDVTTS